MTSSVTTVPKNFILLSFHNFFNATPLREVAIGDASFRSTLNHLSRNDTSESRPPDDSILSSRGCNKVWNCVLIQTYFIIAGYSRRFVTTLETRASRYRCPSFSDSTSASSSRDGGSSTNSCRGPTTWHSSSAPPFPGTWVCIKKKLPF